MKQGKKHWHKEAKRFWKKIQSEYEFLEGESSVLTGAVDQLSTYWKASDQVEVEGLVISSAGGMVRKHPGVEIMKNSWSAFLAGCRLLGICIPETPDKKDRPGRPQQGWC